MRKISLANLTLAQRYDLAFAQIYPPTGFDPINETLHDQSITSWTDVENNFIFTQDELYKTFLKIKKDEPVAAKPANESLFKSIANLFLDNLIYPIAKIFAFPFKLVGIMVNLAKVIVEFIPLLVAIRLEFLGRELEDSYPLLADCINALSFAFYAINFIGRSLTSPAVGIRMAWREGIEYGTILDEDQQEEILWAGYVLGACLVTLSISVSVLFYMAKLPVSLEVTGYVLTEIARGISDFSPILSDVLFSSVEIAKITTSSVAHLLTSEGASAIVGLFMPLIPVSFFEYILPCCKSIHAWLKDKLKTAEVSPRNDSVSGYIPIPQHQQTSSPQNNRHANPAPFPRPPAARRNLSVGSYFSSRQVEDQSQNSLAQNSSAVRFSPRT